MEYVLDFGLSEYNNVLWHGLKSVSPIPSISSIRRRHFAVGMKLPRVYCFCLSMEPLKASGAVMHDARGHCEVDYTTDAHNATQ